MRISLILISTLMLGCQPDTKVAFHTIGFNDELTSGLLNNKIDRTFWISKNKSAKHTSSDTFGYVAYDKHANPLRYDWNEFMGTSVDFQYNSSDFPICKGHHTDTDLEFKLIYDYSSSIGRLYQYWLPQFGSEELRKNFIDTSWFDFNKSGQIIFSDAPLIKWMTPKVHFRTIYSYNIDGLLSSKIEKVDPKYLKRVEFGFDDPMAPIMKTYFHYSGKDLDSTVTTLYSYDSSTLAKSVTYYRGNLKMKTILCDSIVIMYAHKKSNH